MNYWRKVGSSHKGHPEIHQDHMEGSRRKLHCLLVKVLGAGTRCLLQETSCGVMTLCKDKFSEERSLHPHRVTQQGPGAGGAPAQRWTASAGLSLFPPQTIDQDWSGSVYLQRRLINSGAQVVCKFCDGESWVCHQTLASLLSGIQARSSRNQSWSQ